MAIFSLLALFLYGASAQPRGIPPRPPSLVRPLPGPMAAGPANLAMMAKDLTPRLEAIDAPDTTSDDSAQASRELTTILQGGQAQLEIRIVGPAEGLRLLQSAAPSSSRLLDVDLDSRPDPRLEEGLGMLLDEMRRHGKEKEEIDAVTRFVRRVAPFAKTRAREHGEQVRLLWEVDPSRTRVWVRREGRHVSFTDITGFHFDALGKDPELMESLRRLKAFVGADSDRFGDNWISYDLVITQASRSK